MRRWITLVVVMLLMAIPLPAAAAPSVTGEVLFGFGNQFSWVQFVPEEGTIVASFRAETNVFCDGGGETLLEVVWTGSGAVTSADFDRHLRSGSFSAEVGWAAGPAGGCEVLDTPSPTIEGAWDAGGKAFRWRQNGDRHIERTGAGTVNIFSVERTTSVSVRVTVSH